MSASGELAVTVIGKGADEKLRVKGLVVGVSWQTLPTAQVELRAESEALKMVICGLAKVRLKPV